jgi:hypothetical protein
MSETNGNGSAPDGPLTAGRDPATGRFVEGNGFGEGRRLGSVNLTQRIQKRLQQEIREGRVQAEEAVDTFVKQLLDGHPAFWKEFLDRDEGKVTETIKVERVDEEIVMRDTRLAAEE